MLLLEGKAKHVVLTKELDQIPGELGRGVDLGRAGRNPLSRKRPHELADLTLLVGKRIRPHGGMLARAAPALDEREDPARGAGVELSRDAGDRVNPAHAAWDLEEDPLIGRGPRDQQPLAVGDQVSFVNRPTPLKRSIEFRLKTKTLLFPVLFPNTA